MKIEPKTFSEPLEVQNRLHQLGVSQELLQDVASAAVAARNNCTRNHPCGAPGYYSWSEGNRRLRERAFELNAGWEWDETDNIPSIVNRKSKVKITMCNTDYGTGLPSPFYPQQMSHKGSATDRIVSRNQSIFEKVFDAAKNLIPVRLPGGVVCWYLCVYAENEIIRAELSCPISCGEDGLFKDFYERIIILGNDDDGGGIKILKQEPDGGDSGLDISVTKKQAL